MYGQTDRQSGLITHIGRGDPLGAFHVPADLTLAGLKNGDALVGEHIEHVPHTQP